MIDEYAFRMPFNCILVGASNSGKSTFVTSLLQYKDTLVERAPRKGVLFYNRPLQGNYKKFVDSGFLEAVEGPPLAQDLERYHHCFLIFDDQPITTPEYHLEDIFNFKSHHNFLGVICMVHNPYDKGFKTLRQAANVIVLTSNLRNLRHAQSMSREICCYQGNIIYKILHNLCSQPNYDQLIVNLQTSNPNQLMLQSGLIPPNVRKIYNYDSQKREGYRTGELLKNGNQLNTVINNRITQDSSNKNTDNGHNSLNDPIKNTENISNKNQESEGDVTEKSKKIIPENELFPGVEYSPDMVRAMNKTKEKVIPEANEKIPVIKQEDKERNNVSSQSRPEEMSIDYTNSSRKGIQPETVWMESINELGSDSTTGATKGSDGGQYSALTNSDVSSALATAGSTVKQQDTSSEIPHSDVLDKASTNGERNFTKILSDTIINEPLTTTSKSTQSSADSVLQDILDGKSVSTINQKISPSSTDHPQSKDIMHQTTQPVIENSSQVIEKKPQPSIYDEKYGHSRDDSYLPNWTRRSDISLSLPQIKALFQPRIYSSPREGRRKRTNPYSHPHNQRHVRKRVSSSLDRQNIDEDSYWQ